MSPLRVGILTVSDGVARGERRDRSGDLIEEWCRERGYAVGERHVVPDDRSAIVPLLVKWADGKTVDAIVTTGGTGFSSRDVTPEATCAVLEREAPGIAEAIRRRGEASTAYAILSRGVAGVRGGVIIVNLPGSPGGVQDGLAVLSAVLEHASALARGVESSHEPPDTSG